MTPVETASIDPESNPGDSARVPEPAPRKRNYSWADHLWLFLLTPIICIVINHLILTARSDGQFERWRSLGKPPERAVKILAVTRGLWVLTESGRVYQSKYTTECTSCWEVSDYPQPDPPPSFPREMCVPSPTLGNTMDVKERCSPWGPGNMLDVTAIREDGYVFDWWHGRGEGDALVELYTPCIAAAAGLVLAGLLAPFADMVLERVDNRPSAAPIER